MFIFSHGDSWSAFRTKVSRVALSAGAAAQYTVPVAEVAEAFVQRYDNIGSFKICIVLGRGLPKITVYKVILRPNYFKTLLF